LHAFLRVKAATAFSAS